MVDITEVSLLDVLPLNLSQNPDVIAISKAIDNELSSINKLMPKVSIYSLIDDLDSEVLDHLAWGWNADTWRDSWPVSLKRSVFKSIIKNKKIKGTRAAVEDAISSLGGSVSIREWFENSPQAKPYTAEIIASLNDFDGEVPSKEMLDDVILRIKSAKSARTLYSFSQMSEYSAGIGLAGGFQSIAYVYLKGIEEDINVSGSVGVLASPRPIASIRLSGIID